MLNFICEVTQLSGDVLTRWPTLRTEQFTTENTIQNKLTIVIQQSINGKGMGDVLTRRPILRAGQFNDICHNIIINKLAFAPTKG